MRKRLRHFLVFSCLLGLATPSGWEAVHGILSERAAGMSEDLEAARVVLRERADGDPALLQRLHPSRPSPSGFAILPEVRADGPLAPVELRERTHSLAWVGRAFDDDLLRAERLAGQASDPGVSLESLVGEYEHLRGRMRKLEEYLSYHAQWQRAVEKSPEYFAKQTRLERQVEELQALLADGGTPTRVAELRRSILERLSTFRTTPGLAIETRGDGMRLLPVVVWTEIEDQTILAAFREGVEENFARSEAARTKQFAVQLQLRRVSADVLYPEGAPARGTPIDMSSHRGRFPEGSLVLTTGGQSTHAWTGDRVVLGPGTITRRTLAHEFGHLLGFEDAYLRAPSVDATPGFGVVITEWSGLQDDLMGNPGGGRVSPEMIETLLRVYGEQ